MIDPNFTVAIEAAFRAFNERRFADFATYVTDDVVETYPQSGERFEGRDQQKAFHEAFASPPSFTIRNVLRSGDLAVAEVDEHYPDGSVWNDVWILTLRDGLVASMTGYFGQPFPAPEWRRPYGVRPSGGGAAPGRPDERMSGPMNAEDFPAPRDGFVLTHFLVVSDQDRSRLFYQTLFDGLVLIERDPVIMKVANSWLIMNTGGGPTDDKPTVTLTTPPDPDRTSAFLNVRVADIWKVYKEWSAKGATFLTEPKDHGREIRAYIRDPDGHLIEVGQSAGPPG